MITKLLLGAKRSITLHTAQDKRSGGIRFECAQASAYFSLSPKEQARLAYALADHRLRKSDEIKELR